MSFDKKQSTSYSYSKQGVDGVGPMVVYIFVYSVDLFT